MIVDGCDAVVVLGSDRPNTGAFVEKRANLGSHHSCLAEGDSVDPNKKMMVEGFVAAFAKAARVGRATFAARSKRIRPGSKVAGQTSQTGADAVIRRPPLVGGGVPSPDLPRAAEGL